MRCGGGISACAAALLALAACAPVTAPGEGGDGMAILP